MSAFGIREVCHCVFTSKDETKHPSFIIDTAKMSSLESAATTVYAQGGSGNSRLLAWEGEKTLTFTIEDALITPESFRALTGAAGDGNTFKIYPTSFAGYYSITAYTLVRDQDSGVDKVTTITIPNAKLQTQLNLSMSPTGDPSTFTFTFDAMPDTKGSDKNLMFSMEIGSDLGNQSLSDLTTLSGKTIVYINGAKHETSADAPKLTIADTGAISLTGTTVSATIGTDEILTNFDTDVPKGTAKTIDLIKGSTTKWYIV